MIIPEPTRAWLAQALGERRFEIAREPPADSSHTNHRITLDDGRELLLRRFTDADRGGDPWYVARDEVAALEALAGLGLPVPALVAADVDATECDVPTLLITWLPGRAPTPADVDDPDVFVHALAEPLPAIHRCPPVGRRYEPYFVSDGVRTEDLRPPRWALDATMWERAIDAAAAPPPAHVPRFIHRDYHQGNTLFEGARLTGVVDWTTGCAGPVGIDLARMRMNLAWEFEFELELGAGFLDAWREVADDPDAYHPYWDVLDAVDRLGDGEHHEEHRPERLARFEAYTARALAELG